MQIVIMEHTAIGGATWSCVKLESNMRPEVWTFMGHRVVEVSEADGEQMLKDMGASLMLQAQLRELYYREASTDKK